MDLGFPEVQTFQGEVVWEKDAALLAEWGGDTSTAKQDAERTRRRYRLSLQAPHRLRTVSSNASRSKSVSARARCASSTRRALCCFREYNPPEVRRSRPNTAASVLILNATRPAYAKDYVPPTTPIKHDLQQRLADLRAKGPQHKHAVDANGHKTIPKIGNGSESQRSAGEERIRPGAAGRCRWSSRRRESAADDRPQWTSSAGRLLMHYRKADR